MNYSCYLSTFDSQLDGRQATFDSASVFVATVDSRDQLTTVVVCDTLLALLKLNCGSFRAHKCCSVRYWTRHLLLVLSSAYPLILLLSLSLALSNHLVADWDLSSITIGVAALAVVVAACRLREYIWVIVYLAHQPTTSTTTRLTMLTLFGANAHLC